MTLEGLPCGAAPLQGGTPQPHPSPVSSATGVGAFGLACLISETPSPRLP